MNNFTYSYPTKVYFGQDAVKQAFDEELPKAGKTVMPASFAVLDPDYTMSVPPMQVLSGAFDTLSHAMETLIREYGLPTKMGELESIVTITPELLRQVADTCNINKSGPRELGRNEIYDILNEAC